ncbi:MAG: PDZ domain-containing protein [Phycisphaerae bacterium]|nr:PDZ domain-containing protein [Phycisphaerae bacterium]
MRIGTVNTLLLAGAIVGACIATPLARTGQARAAEDLTVRAERIADDQVETLGDGYDAEIDRHRHLIYISALDDSHLRETMALLRDFHDAYGRTMGDFEMPWNITVVLPTAGDFAELVPRENCAGWYYPRGRRLIALDRGQVLLHEFTHALHDAHVGGAAQPLWVREGLATLFEASTITPGGLEPFVYYDVRTVQQAVVRGRSVPLGELLADDRRVFTERTALAYAQVHYVMYYLHQRDRLKDFWRRLQDKPAADPQGIKAVSRLLPGDIDRIDHAWREWVLKLRPAEGLYLRHLAMLGVRVEDDDDGAAITELVSDGPADRANRLHVGDVITTFNGRRIADADALYEVLGHLRAMQTIEIVVLRHGRAKTVRQALGAPKLRK